MTETEYVSQMLTKIKRFAQHYDVHVWFVAHPRQLRDWKGEPPNLYDISGSAHFINKADNGIVIHRNRDPTRGSLNQVTLGGSWPQECTMSPCFVGFPHKPSVMESSLMWRCAGGARNRVVCARKEKMT